MSAADYDHQLSAYLPRFGDMARTPLLSFVQDGYPFSVPCVAEWVGEGEFLITTKWPSLGAADPARGASLLWHHHDGELEDLRSLWLVGWLLSDGGRTVFRLAKQPDHSGLEPVDEAEMFRQFDRNAEKYLADHSLEAPVVNGDVFERLVAEVRVAERSG